MQHVRSVCVPPTRNFSFKFSLREIEGLCADGRQQRDDTVQPSVKAQHIIEQGSGTLFKARAVFVPRACRVRGAGLQWRGCRVASERPIGQWHAAQRPIATSLSTSWAEAKSAWRAASAIVNLLKRSTRLSDSDHSSCIDHLCPGESLSLAHGE